SESASPSRRSTSTRCGRARKPASEALPRYPSSDRVRTRASLCPKMASSAAVKNAESSRATRMTTVSSMALAIAPDPAPNRRYFGLRPCPAHFDELFHHVGDRPSIRLGLEVRDHAVPQHGE